MPENETAIGAYLTTEGHATERCVAGHGLDIANQTAGWAAYNKAGVTWRVDEDTAGEINAMADRRRLS